MFCDMTTEGGGWTVFQRRMDGSVDFYLGWKSYRTGFGNLKGEFWLGNDNLHRLTSKSNMMLRVDMEDYNSVPKYAEYTTFSVANAKDNYRLAIDGYRGTAGDSMTAGCARPAKYVETKYIFLFYVSTDVSIYTIESVVYFQTYIVYKYVIF